MKKTLQRGFTLIELLVVIAIIGILAAVVLASLNDARDGGRDASAKGSMTSIRNQAELAYNSGGDYDGICAAATEVDTLLTAAEAQTSNTGVCNENDTAYAASIPLINDTDYFCVDSTGYAGISTTALGANTVCP